MTLAELQTRVKTQIRAEMATPSVSDLHNTSISQWATEELVKVILIIKNPKHFPELVVIDEALSFTSGSASLPSDFWWPDNSAEQELFRDLLSLKTGSSDRYTRLLSPKDFSRFDSSNFILTPNANYPVGMIADAVYVKPTSITAGKLDYVKTHQAIASGTQFDEIGDNCLTELVLARYYAYRELPDLMNLALERARSYGNK